MTEEPYVKARRADGKYTAVPKSQYEAMGPRMNKEELIMTNYEAIKTMDKDELAEFLSSIMDGQKCPASKKFCDGQRCCADAILNWLNADLDDEPGETSDMIHLAKKEESGHAE